MAHSTYSFGDLTGAITHPAIGSFVFTGEGTGEIIVAPLTEKTAHDVAADGTVMVSHILGDNAQVTIQCQQTSNAHKWLLAAYNASKVMGSSQWAGMALYLRSVNDGQSHDCQGVSFQKVPDKTYQKQGQMVSWVLMAADAQHYPA